MPDRIIKGTVNASPESYAREAMTVPEKKIAINPNSQGMRSLIGGKRLFNRVLIELNFSQDPFGR